MELIESGIDLEKAFGVKVLLKLAAQSKKGLKVSAFGDQLTSNVSIRELNDAVNKTVKQHNIALKSG